MSPVKVHSKVQRVKYEEKLHKHTRRETNNLHYVHVLYARRPT